MENLKKEMQHAINLYKSQKFTKAELLSKKLLEENPKVPFLYNLLGLILSGQRKNDEAIKCYEKGIGIQPNYAMLYNNLGTVYKSKRDNTKAENYYKKSIELNNKIPEAHNNLGNLYIDLNRNKEAITSFKKSVSINSSFYVGHYNLGVLYKSIGEFNKARKCFNEAIKLQPQFYNAHRAFSQINKYNSKDKHISLMEKLYNKDYISFSGKLELSFALGKAFDDIKKFDKAFKYYKEGNKLRRSNIKFSIKRENNEFSIIKKAFNENFFKKNQNIGNEDSTPIFILGMPRSGTTLVEQIISSHPNVYGGGELNYLNDLVKRYFYKDDSLSFELINQDNENNFANISLEYIEKIKKISKKSLYITDKLPINFKWIGLIKLILPKSKVIHCVRNSKDICISIYKNYFTNTELNYAYDLDELVSFYNLYNDLMNFWEKSFPNFIIQIKYEELIKNPKKEIPKLIKKCNLSWDEKCIKFYDNKRTVKTASDTQVRNKIFKSSVDSWKKYEKYVKKNFSSLKN